MNEIEIITLDDQKKLNDFIDATNDKVMTVKGIVVADDGDIKKITADIRELKQREDVLKIAEGKLIKLAGIDMVGYTIENSREQRLLANKNVQNAKQKIKDDAINYFVENGTELISKSQAHVAYKANFNLKKLALETIGGKSKYFMSLLKTELVNLRLRLDNNARETIEKLAIINKYDADIVRDNEHLLKMPVDLLKQTLINRENEFDQKVERQAKELAERVEAERVEAERVEAERVEAERVEAERVEAERVEAERVEAERVEAERVEAERVEAERVEAERVEAERVEAERVEAERVEAERVEIQKQMDADRVADLKDDTETVLVPVDLLKAVAGIGVKTGTPEIGFDMNENLDKKWILKARDILGVR